VLQDEDFDHLFRLGAEPDPTVLPLFAELVRVDALVRRPVAELASQARVLLARHVERRPRANPVVSMQQRFERDLAWIQERGLNVYHAWAFATLRQLGAAFELLAWHVRWLRDAGAGADLEPAAADFELLSTTAKTFILKAARAVNTRKPLDASGSFAEMAGAWDRGMDILARHLAAAPLARPA
jgi:hypothetical protein